MGFVTLLLLLPYLFLFAHSFFRLSNGKLTHELTLENYQRLFGTSLYPSTILFSAGIAARVTVVALLLAYPLAYLLAFKVKRHRNLMYMAVIIPLWVSYLVRAYAWKIILGQEGVLNGFLISIGLIREPLSVLLVQQVGGDDCADPHLHAVHPDADLRGAGVDSAGTQGSQPGSVRLPVEDLPLCDPAAVAPGRDSRMHIQLRAEHGRLHRSGLAGWQRQCTHGLQPGGEPLRRRVQLAARRGGLGGDAGADDDPAGAGEPGGDGVRTDGRTDRRTEGSLGAIRGNCPMNTVARQTPLTARPSDRLTGALWAAGAAVFAFIYLPLAVVVLYAFHDSPIVSWPFKPFTLHWFGDLMHDRGMIAAAIASLKLALLAVVIALGVGVPSAFALDRLEFPGKTAFRRLVLLPLILPGIITGVALLTYFSFLGLSLSSGFPIIPGWPVVLGHGAALTSVVVTQVFARLQRFDRALEEASQDLYANEWQTFWLVTLPTIRSAVLGAGLLVFTLSLDEIAVTFFLIGRQNTLPLQIWGQLRRGITPGGQRRGDGDLHAVGGGDRGVGEADERGEEDEWAD